MFNVEDREIKTFIFTGADIKNNILLEDKIKEYIKDKYYNERIEYTPGHISNILDAGIKDEKGNKIFHCAVIFNTRFLNCSENEEIENGEDKKYKLVIRRYSSYSTVQYSLGQIHLKINDNEISGLDKCFSTDINDEYVGAFGSLSQCYGNYVDMYEDLKDILNLESSANGEVENSLSTLMSRVIKDGDIIRVNNISEL